MRLLLIAEAGSDINYNYIHTLVFMASNNDRSNSGNTSKDK